MVYRNIFQRLKGQCQLHKARTDYSTQSGVTYQATDTSLQTSYVDKTFAQCWANVKDV